MDDENLVRDILLGLAVVVVAVAIAMIWKGTMGCD